MARTKVKLGYIHNNANRRSTLRKRSRGLLKKVNEISVLCGVDSCAIIYSPGEAAPQVWPQTLDGRRILTDFNNLPKLERTRKMTDHLAYMEERAATLRDKVVKKEHDNTKLEARTLLYEGLSGSNFAELSASELRALANTLDQLISNVFGRLVALPAQTQIGGVDGASVPVWGGVALGPAGALAIAEAGPASQAVLGSEFAIEGLGDLGSSSDDTEGGDSKEDDL